MKNDYLAKRAERDRAMFEAGMRTGQQMTHDFIQIALRQPEVVGKDLFGYGRLKALDECCARLDDEFHDAFGTGTESDYKREQLDRALREFCPESEFYPFEERYIFLRKIKYGR